jgi:hypothetical protein
MTINNNISEDTKNLEEKAGSGMDYKSVSKEKVKTTLLMDKTLKKLAQVYAIQNDMTLQEVVELGLRRVLLK